jgi:hypothetical protein
MGAVLKIEMGELVEWMRASKPAGRRSERVLSQMREKLEAAFRPVSLSTEKGGM